MLVMVGCYKGLGNLDKFNIQSIKDSNTTGPVTKLVYEGIKIGGSKK